MKKNILKYSLLALIAIFSFFSWLSVDRAINVPDSSVWLVPMTWFSALFVTICLAFIIIRQKNILELILVLSFFLSFIFIFDLSRVLFFLLALLLVLVSMGRIRKDLGLNIRIDLLKTLGTGKHLLVVALAIMITSQYYSQAKKMDREMIIPKFEMGKAMESVTSKTLSLINPQFKEISNDNMTVDQFILKIQENNSDKLGLSVDTEKEIESYINSQPGGNLLSSPQKEALKNQAQEKMSEYQDGVIENSKNLILEEGRRRLSEISGQTLSGSEKISVVFSQSINKKISDYFKPAISDKTSMPLIPMILAIILFLTIVPLGNFLCIFLTRIIKLVFIILVKRGVLTINKVMTEVEVLE